MAGASHIARGLARLAAVDDAIERARRAVRAAPDDVGAALALAAAAERTGQIAGAWTALVRLVGRVDSEDTVLAALGGLVARHPGRVRAHLEAAGGERGAFSVDVLVRAGRVLPATRAIPIVLACGGGDAAPKLRVVAQRSLWRALRPTFPGLPHVVVFGARLATPGALREEVREFLSDVGHESPTQVALMLQATALGVPPVSLAPSGVALARSVIARARSERLYELLPWLQIACVAQDLEVARAAGSAFEELSGRASPPLDAGELAERLRARAS